MAATITIHLADDGNIAIERTDEVDDWFVRHNRRIKLTAETGGLEDWQLTLNPDHTFTDLTAELTTRMQQGLAIRRLMMEADEPDAPLVVDQTKAESPASCSPPAKTTS